MSNYVKKIVSDYCVLDTETTGLSAYYDEVIEIGILRVRNGEITDRYEQLIKPENEIDGFITSLTGITNEMVADKPAIEDVKSDVLAFLGSDIIVGHNTSFDVRFLAAGFHEDIANEYMDTMQFARKLYPDLPHHRLSDLSEYLHLTNNEHRALADCVTTEELYEAMKTEMVRKGLGIKDLWQVNASGHKGIDIGAITATTDDIDEDGFFYGRHVVFTGKLERMARKDAMQTVVNLGGILDNSVNKNTNYLILGNNDYNAVLHGEKSSKHKEAEKLKLEGQDIDIIDEFTFYDIINDDQ
jgi:DNA polymerase-3 subunit epsilon